jgi:protease IV
VSGKKVAGIVLVVLLVVVAVLLLALPARDGVTVRAAPDAVALVRLQGPIQESLAGGVFGAPGITPAIVRERLETAQRNPRVRAVIIRLDTGGGTVAASQEIASLLEDFPLPVVVSMGDIAASGGYYVAMGADAIVAHPGTVTGSIGVIFTMIDVEELLENIGVRLETITAGEHKDMAMLGPLTDEQRAIIQEMADRYYGQFVDAVAEGRDMDPAQVRRLATGEPFTGDQAYELGLVDALGGVSEALAVAEELAEIEDADIVEFRPGFWEIFFGGPTFGLLDRIRPQAPVPLPDELVLLREVLDAFITPRYGAGTG